MVRWPNRNRITRYSAASLRIIEYTGSGEEMSNDRRAVPLLSNPLGGRQPAAEMRVRRGLGLAHREKWGDLRPGRSTRRLGAALVCVLLAGSPAGDSPLSAQLVGRQATVAA